MSLTPADQEGADFPADWRLNRRSRLDHSRLATARRVARCSITLPGLAAWSFVASFAGALVGLAACSGGGASCGAQEATVERVIDGDTIVLSGDVKIRYLLVNAPEITNGHDDCYGANAAQFNSDLVLGKTVQLAYDTACQDMFGRTLAYVTVDGQDVNRLLVERGYACVLHIPPDGDARADEFKAVELAARTARRGLWGACDPIPCQ